MYTIRSRSIFLFSFKMSFLNFVVNNLPENGDNQIYTFAFHDILRLVIMQVTAHLLMHLSHNNIPLISRIMIETLMFAIAGICVYWFCFYTVYPIVRRSLVSKPEVVVKEEKIEIMSGDVVGEDLISIPSTVNQGPEVDTLLVEARTLGGSIEQNSVEKALESNPAEAIEQGSVEKTLESNPAEAIEQNSVEKALESNPEREHKEEEEIDIIE